VEFLYQPVPDMIRANPINWLNVDRPTDRHSPSILRSSLTLVSMWADHGARCWMIDQGWSHRLYYLIDINYVSLVFPEVSRLTFFFFTRICFLIRISVPVVVSGQQNRWRVGELDAERREIRPVPSY
jgi:hypothetical protein